MSSTQFLPAADARAMQAVSSILFTTPERGKRKRSRLDSQPSRSQQASLAKVMFQGYQMASAFTTFDVLFLR